MSRTVILISILALLLLAGGGYYFFMHGTPASKISCSTRAPRIVAYGDSLVEGYGASTEGGFVTGLSQSAGVPIVNAGVSGNTTADALARISDVVAQKPDIVLLLLGGNDALQRVPLETTKANLGSIIESLQQGGAHVVLIGVIGGFPRDPFAQMFSGLAHQYRTTYVPNILSGIITDRSLMSDEIHPNDAGYAKIAVRLRPILESACASLPSAGA